MQKIEIPGWGLCWAFWSASGELLRFSLPGGREAAGGEERVLPQGERLALCLQAYAAGERVDFSWVPLAWDGYSSFQRRVLVWTRRLPYGETITYGDLSRRLKLQKGARAVGQALAANRTPVIVPCHRVVGQKTPGGFSSGLEWKLKLLRLEGATRPGW
ncbi:methylated-DNA--[protein]-cysteine S-methyltransferase [Desulfothermobacter acidiphilus]|uniref:methylated-DNA--[protein]-cysteine S-methyltransferase n=1 Tax=Desulfothermobacter acidiphilus TaxID=1938353 RepID=UPI003F8B12BD